MQKNYDLSVVIPIYNGMPYLKETIEGILNQTYKDFELILINDGSTDESEEYIKSLSDNRIRYISQENMGLCNTLNKAFSLARGKYIARNDQDDISESTRLEKQIKAIEENNYDCIFTNITKISDTKEWSNIDKTVNQSNKVTPFEPWVHGCMLNSTMLIKKDVFQEIGSYRQEFYPSDDWDLELRLVQKYNVGILEESLLKYRFHESANTYKYWDLMQDTRRWAEDSFYRRQNSQNEITLNEYLKEEKKQPFTYYNRRRKDKAKLYMRKAGSSFLEGKYFGTITNLAMTTLFAPISITKRVLRLLKNKVFK